MNLQGNGNNHNRGLNSADENDSFLKFGNSADYERITGQAPAVIDSDGSVEFGSEDERKKKLKEAQEMDNSSAYEDMDDFIYRQNKRRKRTSGRHHHHHHISASSLSPGGRNRKLNIKKPKKKHKHHHHHHRHHRKRKLKLKRWQKIVIGILIALLSIILIGVIVFLLMYNAGKNSLRNTNASLNIPASMVDSVEDNGRTLVYKGHKYRYNENIANILCMGNDRRTEKFAAGGDEKNGYASGGQADSLFLLSIDIETGKTKAVNISRETMTDVERYTSGGDSLGSHREQICLAYAYGDGKVSSCLNEVTAVKNLFYGLPINCYLSLNIEGISEINDHVGGVTVTSPETIAEFNAGETYNLKGAMAESFVRSRSHEGYNGNSLRMQRQKAYLESFARTVVNNTKRNPTYPLSVFNAAKPYTVSDIDSRKLTYLAVQALRGGFNGLEIENVPGEVKQGKEFAEFYVDEEKFFELFLDVYYTRID